MITPESWPTDPRQCHGLLDRLAQQVRDLDQQLGDLRAALDQAAQLHDQTVDEHNQTVEELRHQIELLRRYIFGPRRERMVDDPGQGYLFELEDTGRLTPLTLAAEVHLGTCEARMSLL